MTPRLRELLAVSLRTKSLSVVRELWEVRESWARAVGARIACHATPVALSRRELLISVPEPVWRQELALLTPELITAVNSAVGEPVVERIRLIGASSPLDFEPPMRRRVLADADASAPGFSAAGAARESPTPDQVALDVSLPGHVATALAGLARARRRRIDHDAGSAATTQERRFGRKRQ